MDVRHNLYKKYAKKHAEVFANITRLEAELEAAKQKGNLIASVLQDMEALLSGEVVPITASIARELNEEKQTSEASGPSVEEAPVVKKRGPGRPRKHPRVPEKTSGKAPGKKRGPKPKVVTKDTPVQEMSIVDAAIELARQHHATEAKAGDVYDWFEEAQYHGRNGVPNRNSIYVSLNREAAQTEGRPGQRISKERRGVFRFL